MNISLEEFKAGIHNATMREKNHGLNKEENKLPMGQTTYNNRLRERKRGKRKSKSVDGVREPSEKELLELEMDE